MMLLQRLCLGVFGLVRVVSPSILYNEIYLVLVYAPQYNLVRKSKSANSSLDFSVVLYRILSLSFRCGLIRLLLYSWVLIDELVCMAKN